MQRVVISESAAFRGEGWCFTAISHAEYMLLSETS